MAEISKATNNTQRWIQCPRCHADIRDRELGWHEFLRCGRCGEQVKSSRPGRTLPAAWAFATAGLIAMVPANMTPILIFSIAGNSQQNLIMTGVRGLWDQGYGPLAALVFFSAIAAPFLYLLGVWYISACCTAGWRGPFMRPVLRLTEALESWNLIPVFSIACIVSVVKLRTLGTVSWEIGAAWVIASGLMALGAIQCFDRKFAEFFVEDAQ